MRAGHSAHFRVLTPKRGWSVDEVVPTCRKPQRLPVVLSRDEVSRFLAAVAPRKHRVILTVCHAAGLRISEAVRLTAAAIDSRHARPPGALPRREVAEQGSQGFPKGAHGSTLHQSG